MTCKDCIHHNKCEALKRLMFTVDDECCELIYQHGVDKSCLNFSARMKTQED